MTPGQRVQWMFSKDQKPRTGELLDVIPAGLSLRKLAPALDLTAVDVVRNRARYVVRGDDGNLYLIRDVYPVSVYRQSVSTAAPARLLRRVER